MVLYCTGKQPSGTTAGFMKMSWSLMNSELPVIASSTLSSVCVIMRQ